MTPREYLVGDGDPAVPPPRFYPESHIWITDAINEIGTAFFGDEWTGEEGAARKLPEFDKEAPAAALRAAAVQRKRPIEPIKTGNDGLIPSETVFTMPTPEEYEAERCAGNRFFEASDWLRQNTFSNNLRMTILQEEWHDIPPELVSGDRVWSAIVRPKVTCDTSLDLPSGVKSGPVFLDKEQFRLILKKHISRNRTSTARARAEAENYVRQKAKEYGDNKFPGGRQALEAEMVDNIKNLSETQARGAWKTAAPKHWKAPGAPRKNNH
jgi:hypothetical protein